MPQLPQGHSSWQLLQWLQKAQGPLMAAVATGADKHGSFLSMIGF